MNCIKKKWKIYKDLTWSLMKMEKSIAALCVLCILLEFDLSSQITLTYWNLSFPNLVGSIGMCVLEQRKRKIRNMSKSVESKFELMITKGNIGKFIFTSWMAYFCFKMSMIYVLCKNYDRLVYVIGIIQIRKNHAHNFLFSKIDKSNIHI